VEIPFDFPIGSARAKPIVVDIAEPIREMRTDGADYLYVTVLFGGVPIGSSLVPAFLDPLPAEVIRDAIDHFTHALHDQRLRSVLFPRRRSVLPTATVIVCTRDRPADLRRCIASLKRLDPPVPEIVIVDNASTNPEAESIASAAGVLFVRELVPGQARARNRGASMASGEIILFTDDDVEVDGRWANELLQCFDDPLVMEATGLVLPACLDTEAQWLHETMAPLGRGLSYRVFDGTVCSSLEAPFAGVGASFAIRKSFLATIGGFPEELGPGMPTEAGDDGYVSHRVLRSGYKIVYDPAAIVHHRHRADLPALRAAIRGYSCSGIAYALHLAYRDRDVVGLVAIARHANAIFRRFAAALLHRGRRLDVPAAEVRGVLKAPLAYVKSVRSTRRRGSLGPAVGEQKARAGEAGATVVPPDSRLPSVSVVIPTRAGRDRTLRLLRALDDQVYPEDLLELIVSIDGDIDGTKRALDHAAFRRPVRVITGDHAGPAVARNRGASLASGEVLLFLDDDVFPDSPDAVMHHALLHCEYQRAAGVGLMIPDVRESRRLLAQQRRAFWLEHGRRLREERELRFTDLCTGNFSIRKAVFEQFNGFVPMLRREDWELGYRLLRAGVTLRAVRGATMHLEVETEVLHALEDAVREGISDVGFAASFPNAFWNLPLSHWESFRGGIRLAFRLLILRRRWSRTPTTIHSNANRVHLARRCMAAAVRLFDWMGVRHRSARLMHLQTLASYWIGVAEGAGRWSRWREVVDRAERARGEPAQLDIAKARWSAPAVDSPAEVLVSYKGVHLGRFPAWRGGVPWSEDRFAALILDHYKHDSYIIEAAR
jgi:GT2 family glycosyltransferase